MQIYPVRSKRDLRAFIQFPYDLYRDDPVWVPPLRSEQWSQFDPKKNPMLDHCETELFLLKEGDNVIGRCSAFIDRLAVEHWGEPLGCLGLLSVWMMSERLTCYGHRPGLAPERGMRQCGAVGVLPRRSGSGD